MKKTLAGLVAISITVSGLLPAVAAAQTLHPAVTRGLVAYDTGDHAKTRASFVEACESGDVDGCNRAGFALIEGLGGLIDEAGARAAFLKACNPDLHIAYACQIAANMQQAGKGGPVDLVAARAAYAKACIGQIADGCYNYALMMQGGQGGAADMREALVAYSHACDYADAESCIIAGDIFGQSTIVTADYPLAGQFYNAACELDNANGCIRLNALLESGLLSPAAE